MQTNSLYNLWSLQEGHSRNDCETTVLLMILRKPQLYTSGFLKLHSELVSITYLAGRLLFSLNRVLTVVLNSREASQTILHCILNW